jgi:hypothetical protein
MCGVASILDRLSRVKANGVGRWLGCCPSHEDHSPSLSIREADGRILLHCFGGFDVENVLAALGLQLKDLFDEPLSRQVAPAHSKIPAGDILQALDHEILVSVACDSSSCIPAGSYRPEDRFGVVLPQMPQR